MEQPELALALAGAEEHQELIEALQHAGFRVGVVPSARTERKTRKKLLRRHLPASRAIPPAPQRRLGRRTARAVAERRIHTPGRDRRG